MSCPRLGTALSLPDVALAELAGAALDFAWIDLEHGTLGPADVQRLAIALRAAGCEAHVRVPAGASALGPVLDAGVDGIVAPCVERAAEAEALVARLRYPPAGTRGYGPRRAGAYGRAPQAGWEPVALTVQIESPAGVRAAAEIAAVDGVTALVVGCADLSLALGEPPGRAAPGLREAVEHTAAAAGAAGKAFGVAASGEPEAVARLAPPGTELVVSSADVRLYARGIDDAIAGLRHALEAAA